MFKGLFGGKGGAAAQRGEDTVWMNHGARLRGVSREVAALAEAERSVVVVALTPAALDELSAALAAREPLRCADIFAKDGLRLNLSRKGTVAVAMSGALPLDLKPGEDIGVDVLVYGRSDTRAADDAIARFADALGPNAHIVFHLSLEDKLLQEFGGPIRPILEKLGMSADEPITHPMVTRAIRNAQEKSRS
jgi:preprotein translocase subunit SecA